MMKAKIDSDLGRYMITRRFATVEPVFGNLPGNKQLNRFTLRGKTKVDGEFEWSSGFVVEDTRKDYKERRFQALGFIEERLHVLVFTPRADDTHVISLRKANKREVKRHEAKKAQS